MCLSGSLTCRRRRRIQIVLLTGNIRPVDGISRSGIAPIPASGKDIAQTNVSPAMTESNQPNNTQGPEPPKLPKPAPGIRWWPLIVIVFGALLLIVTILALSETNRQMGVMICMLVVMAAFGLIVLWLVFFSRLPKFPRKAGLFGIVVLLAAGYALFEIKGTSGDLTPIIGWRFQSDDLAVPEATSTLAEATKTIVGAADFPQFFGPNRDGKLSGPMLALDWKAQPPVDIWRKEVGAGWSGFSVVGRFAITQEQRGEMETVVCYDLSTGDVIWTHTDAARYFTTLGGLGPRATPTIDGDLVFTQGATGILNCLKVRTGKSIWSVDILEDNAAKLPQWGVSGSPLILDDLVIVNPGGPSRRSIVAYKKATGERAWSGGSNGANWSSPALATIGGVRQILMFGHEGIAGHDANGGKVLWSYPWKGGHPHVSMPLALDGDHVLVSSGYGTGSQALKITALESGDFTVDRAWRSMAMKAKFVNLIQLDGYIYGLDDGSLACMNAETGKRAWKGDRFGHGQILLIGKVLLLLAENGEAILFDPNPEEQREWTRFQALTGKTWNPPALAGAYLLVRNDKETACFRLPIMAAP